MYYLAWVAVIIPLSIIAIAFLAAVTDGFKEWVGVAIISCVVVMVASLGWGIGYLINHHTEQQNQQSELEAK